ncbi:hypothetical protein DMI80_11190 [Akkermansia muciniphila]|nr:hypothetical protein DMI78_11175 [Akkermansia muciniphila]QHV68854.1 hypothetical protein DMI79_11235 [Akkermansia muciniphila]QHV71330.1 hypothetical protein DMI80_11190 [Akkermansia muciniphila]QHV73784.1 hypothetical protein DMI81_11190 [Akkermansia muciniphila]
MFCSKQSWKNYVKFDRTGEGYSLFSFHLNNNFSRLLDLFFIYVRIYLKSYRLVVIWYFFQTAFKQLFSFHHFPLDLILRFQ